MAILGICGDPVAHSSAGGLRETRGAPHYQPADETESTKIGSPRRATKSKRPFGPFHAD